MENVMMDENTKCQEVDKVTMELSEFKQLRIWLCWRYEKKNNRDRSTKVPYGADGIAIGTTQDYSGRWSTFEEASRAYEKLGFDGVGFVIPKGFGGIDSDHRKECDPINADLIEHLQTYVENSPSKTGRHWIFKCDTSAIPSQNGKLVSCYYCKNPNNDLEIYFGGMTNRFLTFTGDETQKTAYQKHILKMGSRAVRETMVKDARDKYCISEEDFDKDLDLLNLQNGTLNLKTLEFREHRSTDLISKIANVSYDPAAKSELWHRFIV